MGSSFLPQSASMQSLPLFFPDPISLTPPHVALCLRRSGLIILTAPDECLASMPSQASSRTERSIPDGGLENSCKCTRRSSMRGRGNRIYVRQAYGNDEESRRRVRDGWQAGRQSGGWGERERRDVQIGRQGDKV